MEVLTILRFALVLLGLAFYINCLAQSAVKGIVASDAPAALANGTIISREDVVFPTPEQIVRVRNKRGAAIATAWESLHIVAITYMSDGLKVKGMMAMPSGPGPFPAIIVNRGGNRDFSELTALNFAWMAAMFVQAGYAVVGSDYRGNGGGEGREEFGGADVDDVLALVPLLQSNPKVDGKKIGIYGVSRGGLMTYLALARSTVFKAAVVESGLTDSFELLKDRPDEEADTYRQLIPGYDEHREESLKARSPVLWGDKLSRKSPILILHGTADWRVRPDQALAMSRALLDNKVPFRLVLFEGGEHQNNEFMDEQYGMEVAWFNRYLRDGAPLPNLVPHGP